MKEGEERFTWETVGEGVERARILDLKSWSLVGTKDFMWVVDFMRREWYILQGLLCCCKRFRFCPESLGS